MAKKSDEQALKWMREVCFALPDTSEGVHYGEIVFKVGKEMFASCGDKRGPRTIVFKIDAQRTADLLASDPRFQRYPYEKTALWIKASDVDDWQQLREFVEESYRVILQEAAKPAKARTAPKSGKSGSVARVPRVADVKSGASSVAEKAANKGTQARRRSSRKSSTS